MHPTPNIPRRTAAGAGLALAFFPGLIIALTASRAFADDETPWKAEGTSDGIAIFTRQLPGQPLRDFKGTVQIDAPLAQVAATLADVSTMHEWFFLLQEARFLRGAYTLDSHMYMAIKGIWPVSPRDVVAHVLVRQDPATQAVHIDAQSEDGIMPPQAGYVRIPEMKSAWTLRAVSATKTEVVIEGHGHPGGWIPLPIANFVVTTLPRQCLEKLRVHVAKPEYRDVEKMLAKNPKLRELVGKLVVPSP